MAYFSWDWGEWRFDFPKETPVNPDIRILVKCAQCGGIIANPVMPTVPVSEVIISLNEALRKQHKEELRDFIPCCTKCHFPLRKVKIGSEIINVKHVF
ncbi:unnamed protein product [marine sediment metagenome]|uniref:Uncharacterized protein n=1 Tax=marine sediment metagenome TaxID=412755 RepID=X1LXB8_9ZZZZ